MTCSGTDLKDLDVAHKGGNMSGQYNSVAMFSIIQGRVVTHS